MSTVLHCFRATDIYNFHEQMGIIKYLIAKSEYKPLFEKNGVEVQVFRTFRGIVYRIKENGYGLKNMMWQNEGFFPQFNYNDTGGEPGDEADKQFASFIQHQIERGEYSIVTIVEPEG